MRRRWLFDIAAIASSVGLAAGASAQTAASSAGEWKPMTAPTAADMRKLHEFAACLAADRPDATAVALSLGTLEDVFERVGVLSQKRPQCLGRGRLRVSNSALAGGLAEYMLARRYHGDRLISAVAFDPKRSPAAARSEGEVASMCTVRALPHEVQALFSTQPGSAEETTAMQPIVAKMPECLSSTAQMRVNRIGLRAGLAMAAFRLAEAGSLSSTPAQDKVSG